MVLGPDNPGGPEGPAGETPAAVGGAGMIWVRAANPFGSAPRLQASDSGLAEGSGEVPTVQLGDTTTLTASAAR